MGGEIISTEELKRDIDEVNKKIAKTWNSDRERAESIRKSRRKSKPTAIQERDSLIVFGMDVAALYPSITRDMAKKAVMKAIKLSDTKWENVNVIDLVRAVAMTTDRNEIDRMELSEVVPVPKGTTTLKSFVEPGKAARSSNGDSQFYDAVRDPTNDEKEILIGIMISNTIETVMSNHFNHIGGEMRVKTEGG